MKVVIIGGGIGGMTLAHGLLRQGVAVEVYERERYFGSRWEGYRIDIEEMGLRALFTCLPEESAREIVATAFPDDSMTITDETLKVLLSIDGDLIWPNTTAFGGHYGIDRPTLRRVLQRGLDDVLHLDAAFVRYEHQPDGRVTAVFADGRRTTCDVLIGADGTASRVAAQYLPGGSLVDSGTVCVGFKLPLTDETRRWVPASLTHGTMIVSSGSDVFGFNAVFDPPNAPPGVAPYILHAISWRAAPGSADDAIGRGDEEVRRMAAARIADWHPALRRLVDEAASSAVLRLRASRQRAPWTPTNVVLLGDALHSMPPTAGRGGNTAMRDAHLLARNLGATSRGERLLLDAIGDYEREVRDYGAATIEESMRNIRVYGAAGPIMARVNRMFLRACAAFPSLRARVFGGPRGVGALRPWEDQGLPAARLPRAA